MRFAQIENGIVVNVIEAESADFMPGLMPAGEDCEAGGTFDGVVFIRPSHYANLDAAKVAKRKQINAARDAACSALVTAHNRPWAAEKRDQELLGQAIALAQAGLPLPAVWRDAENNDMPVASLADLLAIAGAIAQQTQAAYVKGWNLKAQVEAAATVEEVSAIQW